MNTRFLLMLSVMIMMSPQLVQARDPLETEVEDRTETRLAERRERQRVVKDKIEERKDMFASRAAEVRSRMQERRDEFEKRQDELASRAAEMRERMKDRRLAFRTKLGDFKDEKKASIAARIDANIDRMNKNHTERFTKVLEKLNEIVGGLEDKVATASSLGKNTASASATITNAKNKISSAQTKVAEQSGKDYAPVVTDEATLGSVVSAAFKAFMKDMQETQSAVNDAKQAVRAAAEAVLLLK